MNIFLLSVGIFSMQKRDVYSIPNCSPLSYKGASYGMKNNEISKPFHIIIEDLVTGPIRHKEGFQFEFSRRMISLILSYSLSLSYALRGKYS